VEKILGIELMSAAQALDFRRPMKSSPHVESLFKSYRKIVSFNEVDRLLHDDMKRSIDFMTDYQIFSK
jgi:histidine ammonia-lyase